EAHQPAMRVIDGRVLEREGRLVRNLLGRSLCLGAGASPERIKQRRLDRAWIEDRFQAPRRQVLDLLVGEIDALALGDPAADLPHDLFDVNLVASAALLRRRLLRPAIEPTPIGSAPPSMEMASPLSLILVHHASQYFLNSWPHSVRMNERMRDWPMVGYQNKSWYTLDAKGAHTISGEWSSRRSSGRRKPLRIIWSPQITSERRVWNPKFSRDTSSPTSSICRGSAMPRPRSWAIRRNGIERGSKPISRAAVASIATESAAASSRFFVRGIIVRGPAPSPATVPSITVKTAGCSSRCMYSRSTSTSCMYLCA